MVGHSIDDLAAQVAKIKNISLNDAYNFIIGKTGLNARIAETGKALNAATFGQASKAVGRFAGSKPVRAALRAVPLVATGFAALDAADIVTNDTNIGNKLMDTAAMGIGGVLGSVGGPVGALAGASTGKFLSDSAQFLLGGGKSPEERKMEEALALLQSGRLG